MRLGTLLFFEGGKNRLPPRPPIKFKEMIPLIIKDKVSTKGMKSTEVVCIQEMTVMFACLKEADFKEAKCAPEINEFQNCYFKQMDMRKNKITKFDLEGNKKLNPIAMNKLLAKYPQPPPRRKN